MPPPSQRLGQRVGQSRRRAASGLASARARDGTMRQAGASSESPVSGATSRQHPLQAARVAPRASSPRTDRDRQSVVIREEPVERPIEHADDHRRALGGGCAKCTVRIAAAPVGAGSPGPAPPSGSPASPRSRSQHGPRSIRSCSNSSDAKRSGAKSSPTRRRSNEARAEALKIARDGSTKARPKPTTGAGVAVPRRPQEETGPEPRWRARPRRSRAARRSRQGSADATVGPSRARRREPATVGGWSRGQPPRRPEIQSLKPGLAVLHEQPPWRVARIGPRPPSRAGCEIREGHAGFRLFPPSWRAPTAATGQGTRPGDMSGKLPCEVPPSVSSSNVRRRPPAWGADSCTTTAPPVSRSSARRGKPRHARPDDMNDSPLHDPPAPLPPRRGRRRWAALGRRAPERKTRRARDGASVSAPRTRPSREKVGLRVE